MEAKLKQSREIIFEAMNRFDPFASVVMFSGGDDSLAMYMAVKELAVPFEFVLHIRTGTGIQESFDFVERTVLNQGDKLIVADAGPAYEEYVLRKGFFGRGRRAHNYAYHVLKASPYRKVISSQIRKRKRNRPVLLLNGARKSESSNRTVKLDGPFNRDPAAPNNIWTSILYSWSKADCREMIDLAGIERNPVSVAMHRSGECMCGTMQSIEDRALASMLYPEWGKWIDDLEQSVLDRGHACKWGIETTRKTMSQSAQQELPIMCVGCDFSNVQIPSKEHELTKEVFLATLETVSLPAEPQPDEEKTET